MLDAAGRWSDRRAYGTDLRLHLNRQDAGGKQSRHEKARNALTRLGRRLPSHVRPSSRSSTAEIFRTCAIRLPRRAVRRGQYRQTGLGGRSPGIPSRLAGVFYLLVRVQHRSVRNRRRLRRRFHAQGQPGCRARQDLSGGARSVESGPRASSCRWRSLANRSRRPKCFPIISGSRKRWAICILVLISISPTAGQERKTWRRVRWRGLPNCRISQQPTSPILEPAIR